jgi:hypothetical protein
VEEQPVMRKRAFNTDSTCAFMVDEITGRVLNNNTAQPHVHNVSFTFHYMLRNALCMSSTSEKEYNPFQLDTKLISEANAERDRAKVVMVSHGVKMLILFSPAMQRVGRLRFPAAF